MYSQLLFMNFLISALHFDNRATFFSLETGIHAELKSRGADSHAAGYAANFPV